MGRKISVVVPTYNEEDNVVPMYAEIRSVFEKELPEYLWELIFIDNASADHTRRRLRELCREDKRVKAIFNARNFGQFNSPYYGMLQSAGDCTILLCADFQDPVDMIADFVREWEKGYKIVIGIKTSSRENRMMYFLRSCYYKIIKRMSKVDQIEHFTGFGLYDKKFIEILKNLNDSTPFLRGIVAELGYERKEIPYEQQKRKSGKSSNNLYSLYDAAMLGFTSYTKMGMRCATFAGLAFAGVGFIIAVIYLILKLVYWDRFVAGTAPILIGVFIFGALQLIFIGILGEYMLSINERVMNRPLVIEEERINFSDRDGDIQSEE